MRTIAQISDLHFGRHDPRVSEDLLASLHEAAPDLVVISGDVTQRARPAEFEAARRFLDRMHTSKLMVPGNHDMPLYDLLRRWRAPLDRYRRLTERAGSILESYGDEQVVIAGLDTTRRWSALRGGISSPQVEAVRRRFDAAPRDNLRLLVTHHPLGRPQGSTFIRLARRAEVSHGPLASLPVDVLMSGHGHRAASGPGADQVGATHIGGGGAVLVVHAGTAISVRTRGGERNSFNLMRVERPRLSVEVLEWRAGHGFQQVRATEFVLSDGRWRCG